MSQAHNPAAIMNNPDTHSGVTNAKLGVWLFLASEIMLFATLFTSYIVLRMASSSWPWGWDVLNVPLATLNTVILITSSVTIVMAYAKAYDKDKGGFQKWMAATILLSLAFLVVKAFEYGHEFGLGIGPHTSVFYAIYFTMTGLHGIHILGGIAVNAGLLYMSTVDGHWKNPLFLGRVEGAGLYWHFVDIVWIFLFPALYLL
ncbi:MAG: cytochrome c oxidase subunit 3 [Elusimicrobia bacterium]|nr:cytochrome c oxidase subunit 3 [Elusimicrobiota bacterium]